MKKRRKDKFRVIVPCKGYTRAYLIHNFSSPDEDWPELVSLAADKPLHDYFLTLLRRGEEREDNRLKGTLYNCQVSVEITYDQFQRYGWMLTSTDTAKFNAMLERRVKSMLYAYISAFRAVGVPLMECIRSFRQRTGITEWMWDTDSIRKDLQRNLRTDATPFRELLQKIEKNVWRVLSRSGTITNQGYNHYTNEDTDI